MSQQSTTNQQSANNGVIKAINLSYPFGSLLSKRITNTVVFSRKFNISGGLVAVIENKKVLAIAVLEKPWPVSVREFSKFFGSHRVSLSLRKRLWPNMKRLFMFKVKTVFATSTPVKLKDFSGEIVSEIDLSDSRLTLFKI